MKVSLQLDRQIEELLTRLIFKQPHERVRVRQALAAQSQHALRSRPRLICVKERANESTCLPSRFTLNHSFWWAAAKHNPDTANFTLTGDSSTNPAHAGQWRERKRHAALNTSETARICITRQALKRYYVEDVSILDRKICLINIVSRPWLTISAK